MFEADALHGIVQFDVDAQVLGIELEFVAVPEAAVLGDVERKRGHRTRKGEFPMPVPGGIGAVIDGGFIGHGSAPAFPPIGGRIVKRHNNAIDRVVSAT
jgi:hypothetical protein